MVTLTIGIVAFGLGVGFSNKVKAGFSALFSKAETAAKTEAAKVAADVKAKV